MTVPENLAQYDTEENRKAYEALVNGNASAASTATSQVPDDLAKYDTDENRKAYEAYSKEHAFDNGFTITYNGQTTSYTKEQTDLLKRAYQALNQNADFAKSALESYGNNAFDQFAMQNGLPSWKLFSKVQKYAAGGGVAENYGNLSDDQWKKINELWAKDWEYGLSDQDYARKAAGLAPVSYDSMYEDTLLDQELKAKGLPPSKLLNGKLGETYNTWVKDAVTWNEINAEIARTYMKHTDADNYFDGTDTGALFERVAKAVARSTYTMEDAYEDVLARPEYASFVESHKGALKTLPGRYDKKYLIKDENGDPMYDENDQMMYDELAWDADYKKVLAGNAKVQADEFALSIDKANEYFANNAIAVRADMWTEEYFGDLGKAKDDVSQKEYATKYVDYLAALSYNDGKGITMESLFPDVEITDDMRKLYQPYIDHANNLLRVDGYTKAVDYVMGGTFETQTNAARQTQYEQEVISSYRQQYSDVDGWNDKHTDEQILDDFYKNMQTSYGMSDAELASIRSGESSIAKFMEGKISDESSAMQFGRDRLTREYAAMELPTTWDGFQEELGKLEWIKQTSVNVDLFDENFDLTSIVSDSLNSKLNGYKLRSDALENYNGKTGKELYEYVKRYYGDDEDVSSVDKWLDDRRATYDYTKDASSISLTDDQKYTWAALDILSRHEDDADLATTLNEDIASYKMQVGTEARDRYAYLTTMRDLMYSKTLDYTAAAFMYFDDFADVTKDMGYVNRRFDELLKQDANTLMDAEAQSLGSYATDEEKKWLVYAADKSITTPEHPDGTKTDGRFSNDYLDLTLMRRWDMLKRRDNYEKNQALGDTANTGFGNVSGNIGNFLVASLVGQMAEGVWNFGADTVKTIAGKDIYASSHSTWASDTLGHITEDVRRDAGDFWAGAVSMLPSMIQSAEGMALASVTGGASEWFTLAAMGMEAYSSASEEALSNGATSHQAFAVGLLAGGAEVLFEKVSLDAFVGEFNLIGATSAALKGSGKVTNARYIGEMFKQILVHSFLVQGPIEGSEELFTGIANTLSEQFVLGANSSLNLKVKHYMDGGMSESDAYDKAIKELVGGVLMEGIMGWVSGAMMGFGGDIISVGKNVIIDKTGYVRFLNNVNSLSAIKVNDAIQFSKENVKLDENKRPTLDSVKSVFDGLLKKGADNAVLSAVRNELFQTNNTETNNYMDEMIRDTKARDYKALAESVERYMAKSKSTENRFAVRGLIDKYMSAVSDVVQKSDQALLQDSLDIMRSGFVAKINELTVGDSRANEGATTIANYVSSLSEGEQAVIKGIAERYVNNFKAAGMDGAEYSNYANMAAALVYATQTTNFNENAKSAFGISGKTLNEAINNACLDPDAKKAKSFIDNVCKGIAAFESQKRGGLLDVLSNGMNSLSYVPGLMAQANSHMQESASNSVYRYIDTFGCSDSALSLLAVTNHFDELGSFLQDQLMSGLKQTRNGFVSLSELQQKAADMNNAKTEYENKQKSYKAAQQSVREMIESANARVARYQAEAAAIRTETVVDGDGNAVAVPSAENAKAAADIDNELNGAISQRNKDIWNGNQKLNSAMNDLNKAQTTYNSASAAYTYMLNRFCASYTHALGAQIQSMQRGDSLFQSDLDRMTAYAQNGTRDDVNRIEDIIRNSEKTAAAAFTTASGIDTEIVKFDSTFCKKHNVDSSKRACEINGKLYINENFMDGSVGYIDGIIAHELGHVAELSANNYAKLVEFANKYLNGQFGKESIDAVKQKWISEGMSQEQADKEMIAEFCRNQLLSDPTVIVTLCNKAPVMSTRIMQWLANTKAKISKTGLTNTGVARNIDTALRWYAKALKDARVKAQDPTNIKALENAKNAIAEANDFRETKQETTTHAATETKQTTPTKTQTEARAQAEENGMDLVRRAFADADRNATATDVGETVEETAPATEQTAPRSADMPITDAEMERVVEEVAANLDDTDAGIDETVEETATVEARNAEQTSQEPVEDFADIELPNGSDEWQEYIRRNPVGKTQSIQGETLAEDEWYEDSEGNKYDAKGNLVQAAKKAAKGSQIEQQSQQQTSQTVSDAQPTANEPVAQPTDENVQKEQKKAPNKTLTKEMKPLVDAFIEAERKKFGWQQPKVFKKTTAAKNAQSVLKSATALSKKKTGITPALANAYTDEDGRQIVTDSYRAYRFENAIDSLPKLPEGASYPKIGDMLNRVSKSNTTEVPMPSLVILEELAKNKSNTYGKRLNYSFGENMPSVNAKFLYELCSTFPTAKLYIDSSKGAMSTLYAKSENGDGLLSPVRSDAKVDAETASNLKNALREYARDLKDPMPYITDESINEFVNNYAADALVNGIQPRQTRSSKVNYYTEANLLQSAISGMTERERTVFGSPKVTVTNNGVAVTRLMSPEGFSVGDVTRDGKRTIAAVARASHFTDGTNAYLRQNMKMGDYFAAVIPGGNEYATLRAKAREQGVNVVTYDETQPHQFDNAQRIAAESSNVNYYPSNGSSFNDLIQKYGAIPEGMTPRRTNRPVPQRTRANNRVSQMVRTAAEAPITTDATYERMPDWIQHGAGTFVPTSNKKTLEQARNIVANAGSLKQAAAELHGDVRNGVGKNTDLLARAEVLFAEMQNDNTLTDLEREHIFSDLCIIASDSGRALQLSSELKRMTPEGHIDYIEQVGKRTAERHNKRHKKKVDLTLTDEEKEAYKGATTDKQRKAIDEEVSKRWGEQMQDLTLGEKIRNWRYFSMLGNPRTHLRNIIGNTMMLPIARLKDTIEAGYQLKWDDADKTTTPFWMINTDEDVRAFVAEQLKEALPKMQGVSSKYVENVANNANTQKDLSQMNLKEMLEYAWKEENPSTRITDGRFKIGRGLNKLSAFNSNALEVEDAFFLSKRFMSSMYQQIKAKGLDVNNMTDAQKTQIVDYAMEQALQATFRDASALADALNKLARSGRVANFMVESVVPFRKTPINIAKRGVEYSPIGFTISAYQAISNKVSYNNELKRIDGMNITDEKKAQMRTTAEQEYKRERVKAIDKLAAGTTGSLLTAIGAFAAAMGWISIGRKDDEADTFETALGKNNYSLNIGDVSIDLSAFSPAAIPLLMGTAIEQSVGADREDDMPFVSALIEVLCESVDPITEMSMLSGLADTLLTGNSYAKYSDGGKTRKFTTIAGKALESYVGQFVPTFVGQTARIYDPYARSYSAGKDYWASRLLGSEIGGAVKSMQNKIGLGWLEDPKVDLHGNDVRNYTNFGSFVLNWANNRILPATIKMDQKNEIDDELVRLYGVVDSSDIFPTKPSRTIGQYTDKTKNKTYQLKLDNDSQYAEYQREYGQTVYDMLYELMQSMAYRNMTDEERSAAVEKVIDKAKSITKKRWKAMMVTKTK